MSKTQYPSRNELWRYSNLYNLIIWKFEHLPLHDLRRGYVYYRIITGHLQNMDRKMTYADFSATCQRLSWYGRLWYWLNKKR
jgi:hypothetical protein